MFSMSCLVLSCLVLSAEAEHVDDDDSKEEEEEEQVDQVLAGLKKKREEKAKKTGGGTDPSKAAAEMADALRDDEDADADAEPVKKKPAKATRKSQMEALIGDDDALSQIVPFVPAPTGAASSKCISGNPGEYYTKTKIDRACCFPEGLVYVEFMFSLCLV